jgi:alanine dehydrogenase
VVRTRYSTVAAIDEECFSADIVAGAVLIAGAAAPKLVTREMMSAMKKGTELVDVAIDQSGCFETHATTQADYRVANMQSRPPFRDFLPCEFARIPLGQRR